MPKYLVYVSLILLAFFSTSSKAHYERNKAVPVEKVLFGQITSKREITETEIVTDRRNGWNHFGGALIGGAIGNQFGDGSGRVAATILGALIGANASSNRQPRQHIYQQQLVELMIRTEHDGEFMVIQDNDPKMQFNAKDKVRMVYLANGNVRVDRDY
ncbi:glycine zipper 2TM domain-containing protein [Pseudoalteromonas tunicata]|jgi:outer membrane lipoprotein SlyB|uniref:Glycine zipper 2TM domain-containing protein n=1 Tax=Pseudoalteromonas tunicata D2 TaxID=87626 RepID=A4C3X8_9GAMM|nr:glycine zipper 2TM domain-containing protein [Pseudoalteromonas tunicata]ATC97255.1 outer membrane lipoprotein SlyB [Pseudoalteromonas tunicata]AXT33337.1 glycine zipper 2TM domain-containing protein [Pseudoalteromonas tunicata]EAR30260.1 hypothetical protein PTD2_01786 [Pseudoalteromonas tunicata D2]